MSFRRPETPARGGLRQTEEVKTTETCPSGHPSCENSVCRRGWGSRAERPRVRRLLSYSLTHLLSHSLIVLLSSRTHADRSRARTHAPTVPGRLCTYHVPRERERERQRE